MAFENFYITNKGKRLLAKAQVGSTISFSRAEIGSGVLPAGDDILARTSLVQAVKSLSISGVMVNRDQAQVTMNFSNQDISVPFYWREVGLYATDPDDGEILYAYGYEASHVEYIPTFSAGPMEFLFSMVMQIGDSANITAVVDSSMIYCTEERAQQIAGTVATTTATSLVNAKADEIVTVSMPAAISTAKSELQQYAEAQVQNNALLKTGGTATGMLTAGGAQTVGTPQMRNIYAGTTDLTAGTSALATGNIYFVYE
ncbi:MAG: hypothetical protein HFI72_05735 [Peptococcaceae bacterium]|jgi:hypothetical protein|nr:hypothetical protein [Peptococcaceae bacterium]